MRQCPRCGAYVISDKLITCLACGLPLEPTTNFPTDDKYTVSVQVTFTVSICDKCGATNLYSARSCVRCSTAIDVGTKEHSTDNLDPKVVRRREALTSLRDLRDAMLEAVERQKILEGLVDPDIDEDIFRQRYLQISHEFQEQMDNLRRSWAVVDFGDDSIGTDAFVTQIATVVSGYQKLFAAYERLAALKLHPTWTTLYDKTLAGVDLALRGYLGLVDAAMASNALEAGEIGARVEDILARAGRALKGLELVFAGKRLRYDGVSGLPAAIASLAVEGIGLVQLRRLGWDYFEDVFERPVKELPEENGFILAIWSIVAESLDNPRVLKDRVRAVTDLFRSAFLVDPPSLKSVVVSLEDDISHGSRLVANIGLQFIATDFARLHVPLLFDMLLNAYQRLSEGAFKSLLTIVLFCEELASGRSPDYDALSKKGFTKKTELLKESLRPAIAGLADDLLLYVRHADAHCDFRFQENTVLINERDNRTKALIATHEYTLERFERLVLRLFETVLAISIGIRCFQIEQYEDRFPSDNQTPFTYEKIELFKYLFATSGIVVVSIDLVDQTGSGIALFIKANLLSGLVLKSETLLVLMKTLAEAFPEARLLETRLADEDGQLLGVTTIPTSHFERYDGPGRHGELVLLDLRYRTLTEYAQPRSLFDPSGLTEEQAYFWCFFKSICTYETNILLDCISLQRTPAERTAAAVRALHRELVEVQRILLSEPAPSNLAPYHALASRAVSSALRYVRGLQLTLRRKTNVSEDELNVMMTHATALNAELLEFVTSREGEEARPAHLC